MDALVSLVLALLAAAVGFALARSGAARKPADPGSRAPAQPNAQAEKEATRAAIETTPAPILVDRSPRVAAHRRTVGERGAAFRERLERRSREILSRGDGDRAP